MSGDGLNAPGYIIPSVRYRDAPAAIEWLCRAFGFTPLLVVPGEDGAIAHAELTLGKGMIMLGSADANGPEEETGPPPENGPATHSVYVVVEQVDTHYERARDAGANIVYELEDQHYGGRLYGSRDPEGHLWYFGSYDPWAVNSGDG